MTSKQVMLTALVLMTGGCALLEDLRQPAEPLVSPYASHRVWAVAPLTNLSGTQQADGTVLADHLHRQLATAADLDVLPVNRTLQAMHALGVAQIASPKQAQEVLRTLGADGLVVGSITAYDPYDPPKLGLALELYTEQKVEDLEAGRLRELSRAATDPGLPPGDPSRPRQPVSRLSAVLDAGDPAVRPMLQQYAVKRGAVPDPEAWRRYRISMDLYSEFVSYVMCWRLLDAERQRLGPAPQTQPAP